MSNMRESDVLQPGALPPAGFPRISVRTIEPDAPISGAEAIRRRGSDWMNLQTVPCTG
jgi:hypothetical protein